MVITDGIEGIAGSTVWLHYDVGADVLYVRPADHREREAVGKETDDGDILLRDARTDRPNGLTSINWWKRFRGGPLPDSLTAIQEHIEPLAGRVLSAV